MRSNGGIAGGSHVWFGISTEYFWYARFDYGSKCYRDDNSADPLPAAYPLLGAAYYDDFRLSLYFTYSSAQNYVRTLTQGVTLTDSRKPAGGYRRGTAQTVKGTAALSRLAVFPRQCLETVRNAVTMKGLPTLARSVIEHVRAVTGMHGGRGLSRNCTETVKAGSGAKRSRGFYRKTQEGVGGTDTTFFPVLFLRLLPETAGLGDSKTQWGAYVRGLLAEAAGMAETRHGGEYCRKQADTVRAAGMPLRSLSIFVRLLTIAFVRDFLSRRFLRSNEELVLKSKVCREIILDSRIGTMNRE
jgi:hypothetical protein